jgi:hypothetical protein
MNCYLCCLETRDPTCPALSICQSCGAGICERHLVTTVTRSVVGMGTTLQRRRMFCTHCSENTVAPSSPVQRKEQRTWSRVKWGKWFWRARRDELPEPKEAVALAERWLQRRHPHS